MDSMQMLSIVGQYCRKSASPDVDVQIVRIADRTTVFIEQISGSGRAVMLTEYNIDGTVCWAGYSSRTQTVYISMMPGWEPGRYDVKNQVIMPS